MDTSQETFRGGSRARDHEIIKASIIGIVRNMLLVAFKLVIGFFSHSIAIILDGVNNATDALSSIITIVGTKLAARRPDRHHPFGYGRIEYLTSVVIAIIILDNTNKWAGLVLNGMEQVMLPAGYQTVVCTSNFNPETELMYVDKMLSLGVDGFIIQPTANFKAVHDRIRRAGKPVVFFDAAIYSPGTSWIKTNLYDGVYNATQALLDAGYEDFFSIAANMTEMRTRMERFQGYAEALAANGQLYKAISIDHNKPSASELTEYFKYKLNPAKRTLIFVQNQWALPRVYKALQPMAHLLPQQIGLLGLNCEDWTNLTTPTVSTIIEPVDQEGREAAEMLLALLDGSSTPGEQRILECKLNWLGSTSI